MARPLRIDDPGAIHHVTGRMLGRWQGSRERLFRDERDYRRFLEGLGQAADEGTDCAAAGISVGQLCKVCRVWGAVGVCGRGAGPGDDERADWQWEG